ncbi:putative UTP--glucose-1-phosphate uridylyltransferase [Mycena sanguinolenta]|uniref:UTP--glucose-1-phosphate uridylyltransferase n=1 Tax=Mycena sanguinolenta TaxID=230812 RepID=A0A8H6ZH94_9AGAR|nr:putative UTP--glucose-1-phosphate uridylyltransferase [Mycena sanguinolenta]
MSVVLPAYSPAPSYAALPRSGDAVIEYTPRIGQPEEDLCNLVKRWRDVTIIFKNQDKSATTPTYGRSSSVCGELGLENSACIATVTLKLEGRINLSSSDCGSIVQKIMEEKRVLFDHAKSGRCPSVVGFALPFPTTYKDDGKVYKIPPSYDTVCLGSPLIVVKCSYKLTITITKHKSGRLSFLKSTGNTYSLNVDFRPRTRPARPIIQDAFFSTLKAAPSECAHINPISCHFMIPSVQTFCISEAIPFHIQLCGPQESLQHFYGSAPEPALPGKRQRRREYSAIIRVFLARQIYLQINGRQSWRTINIGEGKLRPIPPLESPPNNDKEVTEVAVDWEGEVNCKSDVTCGSFSINRLVVKVGKLLVHKRFHRPRAPLTRTQSAPQLISTNTTQPFHNYTTPSMANANLLPRADSFNARVRGTSHIDFRTATTGVAAKTMRNEIGHLVATVADPQTKKAFDTEMQAFFYLFTRYLSERAKSQELDWDRIKSPAEEQIVPYANLPKPADPKNLNKLAVLKVNGGLGTSMGMTGAKSALEVKDDMTFLDLTVRQIEHLNTTSRVDVPLILMTSFNTHEDTLRIIKKYANQQLRITTFNQSRYPRIYKESLLPCPKRADDDKKNWYPPGHGDLYNALLHSGVLDQLLAEGKEYLFVSNSDNLGAVVDESILQHMIDTNAEFLMEVTDKTKADIKGGTLIDYEGSIRLLEIAQVPSEHVEDFKSVRKFKIFNTNNLWINLKALKRIMETDGMELEIIINPKVTDDGQAVVQLETAAGAAIKHFKNAHGINVPRKRFLPVKSCSDLLLIKSDIYSLEHGQLVINEQRMFETTPVIKLGDHFKKIQQFQKRFKKIPKIIELDHLTVTGDVYFGRNVTLRGTVIVVANEGQRIDIPDGCILENRLLSGNLNMTEL